MDSKTGLALRRIHQTLGLGLAVLAFLIVGEAALLYRLYVKEEGNARAVTLAAQQSTDSQRVAYALSRLEVGAPADRIMALITDVDQAVMAMEQTHAWLIAGDPERGVWPADSAALSGLYFGPDARIDEELRLFLASARRLADAHAARLAPSLVLTPPVDFDAQVGFRTLLHTTAAGLRQDLDRAMAVYAEQAEAAARRLQAIVLITAGVSLAILAALAFLVMRPMLVRLQRQMADLAEARGFSNAVLDSVLDGVVTMDENNTVLSFSRSAERIFGYRAEEMVGRDPSRLMPDDLAADHAGIITAYLETGKAGIIGQGRELTARRRDGSLFPIEMAITETRRNNRPLFVSAIRDVSARKAAMFTMRMNARALNATNDIIAAVSRDYKYVYGNRAHRRMNGLDDESPMDLPVVEVVGEDLFRDMVKPALDRCFRGEEVRYDTRFNMPGKEKCYFSVTYLPLQGEDGTIDHALIMVRDITLRVAQMIELDQQRAFFQSLFLNHPDAIVIADPDHRIIDLNPAAQATFGVTLEAVKGRQSVVLYDTPRDFERICRLPFARDEESKTNLLYRRSLVRYRRADGSVFDGETVTTAVPGASGHTARVVSAIRDITARLAEQRELVRAKARLEEAQRMAHTGSWTWDLSADTLDLTVEAARILGWPAMDARPWSLGLRGLVHAEDRSRFDTRRTRLQAEGGFEETYRILVADGGVRWVFERGEVVSRQRGEGLVAEGFVQDITARKVLDLRLARQQEGLRLLIGLGTDPEAGTDGLMRRGLAAMAAHLGLSIGIVSRITEEEKDGTPTATFEVMCHVAPEGLLETGQVFDLAKVYCAVPWREDRVVALAHVSTSPLSARLPRDLFALEAYISVPLVVEGRRYGTVSFSDPLPRGTPFGEDEEDLVRLFGRWIAALIERDTTRRLLAVSEERLRRSQTFANIGTWDWSIDTGDLFWSDRIAPLFGHPSGALDTSYDNFLAAVHPDDRAMVQAAISACLDHGAEYDIEHRVVWPDGSIRWLSEKGDALRDAKGRAVNMLGVVQDITRIKEAEEKLQQFRNVIEEAGYGVLMTTPKGGVFYANSAARRILEAPGDALMGCTYTDWHPETESPEMEAFHHTITRGGRWTGVLPARSFAGRAFPLQATVATVADHCGRVQIRFAIITDYSDELRRQEEMQQARYTAERANRAKSEFLSNMSHELRTPLNAILGFGQILQMDMGGVLSDRQRGYVEQILKAGDHLLALITEVLDLARIEAGRLTLSIETVRLDQVVSDSLALVSPLAEDAGITLAVAALPPEGSVRADHVRLKQVLVNLLSNAIKYNRPEGRVDLSVTVEDGRSVRFAVRDTGVGIPEHRRAELFQPFSRLGAEASDIEGTGIGLVVTRELVQAMGGVLDLDSTEGEGSTFWVVLPVGEDGGGAGEGQGHGPSAGPARSLGAPEDRLSILYVEDNAANRDLLEAFAKEIAGLSLITVGTAEVALDLLKTRVPDLVLMDLNLPGMGGLEALAHIRARQETRNLPVVAVTADATMATRNRVREAGFRDILTKPLDMEALWTVIDDVRAKDRAPDLPPVE